MANHLSILNNNHAAKLANERKTPYVPWNGEEITEPGFIRRIPFVGSLQPHGWEKVREIETGDWLTLLETISKVVASSSEPLGFTKIEHRRFGVYRPLAAAHEPGGSARK